MAVALRSDSDRGKEDKHFVARIVGRHPRYTFEREFVGKREGKRGESKLALVDSPGLYQVRDAWKRRDEDSYYVIYEFDGDLHKIAVDVDQAMDLARESRIPTEWSNVGRKLRLDLHLEQLDTIQSKDSSETIQVRGRIGPFTDGQMVTVGEMRAWRFQQIDRLRAALSGDPEGVLRPETLMDRYPYGTYARVTHSGRIGGSLRESLFSTVDSFEGPGIIGMVAFPHPAPQLSEEWLYLECVHPETGRTLYVGVHETWVEPVHFGPELPA